MTKRTLYSIGSVAILALCALAMSRLGSTPRLFEHTGYLMDTAVTVKLYAVPPLNGDELIEQAFAEAKRIETIMQVSTGNGELHRINERSGETGFQISAELREVLERAVSFYEVSGGAFDPTIAPVKWLWGFDEGGHVPPEDALTQTLTQVGFDRVMLRGDSLILDDSATRLDLGGIAKGYIVDRMIALMKAGGADAALVNAGGDICSFGTKPGDVAWVIGLRHPRNQQSLVLESMPLHAVATSGDYERFFVTDGVRYHHILDPATGYPARGCTSVTVWTDAAMDADVLATTLFVKGPEEGIALAQSLADVEALIFYEQDGELKHVMTAGVEDKLAL